MEEPVLLTVFTDPMMGLSDESEHILDAPTERSEIFVNPYVTKNYPSVPASGFVRLF